MKPSLSPLILLPILLLFGCNYGSDSKKSESLPTEVNEEIPSFSSFNLSDEYIYWEIRVGNMPHQDSTGDEVIVKYDENIFLNLTSVEKSQLASIDSVTGFDAWCAPSYCPVFGVALLSNEAIAIESRQDLLAFFGAIDTVAELSRWISTNNYGLRKYEITDYGFRVIASWDNDCGTRGEDLIKVFRDGTIEKIRELSSESYNGCV
jgi:hypothetical protein